MKEALLRFEVEVMKLSDFEDVMNCASVIVQVRTGGDSDIIHVNSDSRAEGFMLENDITINIIHHGLEGRWRVGKSEIHDCRFKESVSGFECCFLFIAFTNAYIVIPPSDVKFCVYVCITEVADEICD